MKKQYVLIAVISFLLFGIGSAFGQEVSEEAKRHFDRGMAAVEMAKSPNDYAAAINEFEQAARLAPDWPDVYYNLGKVQEAAEKYGDAARSFREYLRLAPDAEDAEEIKSLINELEYKAERALVLTDADVAEIIASLGNRDAWDYAVPQRAPDFDDAVFGAISRVGDSRVKVPKMLVFRHPPKRYEVVEEEGYQYLNIAGPGIKFCIQGSWVGYPIDPGFRTIKECYEIMVVSKASVKVSRYSNAPMALWTRENMRTYELKKRGTDASSMPQPSPPPQTDCGVGDTSGIISYWKFDEINGTLATDSIGQNTGELTYTRPASDRPLITAGLVDNGLRLIDGQYVAIPNNAALNITGDLTIAMWVKPDSVICIGADPAYVLVSKRSRNVPTPYEFMIGCGGSLRYEAWGGRQPFANAGTEAGLVIAGVWQHVAMTRSYSGTIATVTFYINGISVGSSSQDIGTTVASPDPVWISRDGYHSVYTSQGTYAGLMDEIAIFNRALNSSEILNLYNCSKDGNSYCASDKH